MKKRIVIIGNGVIGNLCALYLHKHLGDDAEIIVVGPEDRGGLPVVGESTIEVTAQLLEEDLGLGEYLATTHFPKFGLTYYFQLDPSKVEERTYSVHCNEVAPNDLKPLPAWKSPYARPPSWQLNREVFDRDMRALVDERAIERIHGMAQEVTLGRGSEHVLRVKETGGREREVTADWLIDASGRGRFLARRLDMTIKPEGQRDVFWFRLKNYDRSHLKKINALGPHPAGPGEEYHHDRHFSTHHWFGRGNWIWCIPMRMADDSELISVGITSHPDFYKGPDVSSLETFYQQVETEHPCVADMVKSGEVVDTNRMRRYRYMPKQVYSPDRWCIIGDAGYSIDPLFSNGLAFSSLQMRQVGAMIAEDIEGRHDPDYVDALSRALVAPLTASQDAITDWYASMHDAYLANLRLYWIEISYFYLFLPLVHNRCYYDREWLPLWQQVLCLRQGAGESRFDLPPPLLESRKRFDIPQPEHFIYMGKEKVNPRALEDAANLKALQDQLREGTRLRARLMKLTLDRTGRSA